MNVRVAAAELVYRRRPSVAAARALVVSQHARGLSVVALLTVWLMRRFVFTTAIPAGTDMLGFISRSRQNASLGAAFSMWSPSVWGAVRAMNLENILGLATIVTGDPVVTVKIFAVVTLFASGAFAYMLTWRLYRSTFIATFAGLAFMGSQATLSRWASGQLNVEMAIAAAPLLILLWIESVERYAWWRALRFGIAVALVMLVRPDMVLYVTPFLVLHVVLALVLAPRAGSIVRAVLKTAAITLGANLALGAYQIVPLAHGVKATWLSSGGLFKVDEFVQRSLAAYPSLLGFGRELGYLGFIGEQTWFFHPWVPLWMYELAASVLVALALLAVRWRRDRTTIYFLACALLGAFLAKGVRAPLGGPYLFAVRHVPVFGNLRGPNRWLIVGSLVYGILAGITCRRLAVAARQAYARSSRGRRAAIVVGAAVLVGALLLPVGPTLLSGFRTWRPQPQQVALLRSVERDHSQFVVATIPFDQNSHFLVDGSYRGYEHDLGAESSTYTGHPALADGGWNQKASDTVAFDAHLLQQRDPAFARLLGTAGAKYLVRFDYPENAPHLLPPAVLARGGPDGAAYYQQRAARSMRDLSPLTANSAGVVYALPDYAAPVTFRPNLAVVLGGRSGLAALADQPDFHIDKWAAVTADDAIEAGGMPRLISLIRSADLLVVANEQLLDVAVLATPAVGFVPGLSSDPGLDRETELLPSDESTRTGAMADQSVPPADVGVADRSTTFALSRPRVLELWSRIEGMPTAARLVFRVDGRVIRNVLPLAPLQGGFKWERVGTVTLGAGTHVLRTTALPSMYGSSFEIDETKLVDPALRSRLTARLDAAYTSSHAQQLFALGVDDMIARTEGQVGTPESLTDDVASFWGVLDPRHTDVQAIPGPYGRALGFTLHPGRVYYTLFEHRFTRPLNWSARRYLYLTYKGTGSGLRYRFFVDVRRDKRGSPSWSFVDSSPGWHTVAFSTRVPELGNGYGFTHVRGVRIVTDSRDDVGSLELGRLSLSPLETQLFLRYPLPASREARVAVLGGHSARLATGPTDLQIAISEEALGRGERLIVRPRGPIAEAPAPRVAFHRTADTTYTYRFTTRKRGVLILAQAYDKRWTLTETGVTMVSESTYGLVNGFSLREGSHAGTISFGGQGPGHEGMLLSGFALLVLLPLAAAGPRATRWRVRRRAR